MQAKVRLPSEALFLVVGTAITTTARAMTLSFLMLELQQTFGLGAAMIGFLLGLGSLMGAVAAPLAGALSDKVGRKVVLTSVMIAHAFAMIALALAETIPLFVAAQSLAAVATSIFGPISRALMSDICPEAIRLKCFSWRHMASNIGWVVGPLIGIAAGVASTSLFLTASGIYVAYALALCMLRFPPSLASDERSTPRRLSSFVQFNLVVRDRRLLFFIGGSTLLIAVYGQWAATLAPYLTKNVPDGAQIFAYLLSINGAVVVVGNPVARRLVERIGPFAALASGCALFLISQVGFGLSESMTGFAIFMVIFTFGEILVVPSEYVLVDRISTAKNRGSYFGVHSISTIGSFLGPTLGGVVLDILGGTAMFIQFGVCACAGAALFAVGSRAPISRRALNW